MDYDDRHDKPDNRCDDEICKRIISRKADVNVPIEIKPAAVVGKIEADCCGEPRIVEHESKDSCRITIIQSICVKIPIKYNVSTNVGDSSVVCHHSHRSPD